MNTNKFNKKIIVVLVLIIVFLSAIIIYMLIDKKEMKNETIYDTTYLKWLGDVKLHYGTGTHPAFGYRADVNTFLLENDVVEVIDNKDGWAKINISGWVPEWYLTDEKPTMNEIRTIYPIERRTIKEDTHLYLTPEKISDIVVDSNAVQLTLGQVVELLYEYEDWYYVKRYIKWDSNNYPEGWIEKKYLATFEELKPSEVLIKKGTMVGKNQSFELDRDIKGRISSDQDGWYVIIYPGAGFLEVKKEYVIYEN